MSTLTPPVVARCARWPIVSTPRSRSDGPASSGRVSRVTAAPARRWAPSPGSRSRKFGTGPRAAPAPSASIAPADGFVPAIDAMRDTAGPTSFISPAAASTAATRLSDPIADVAVDAWSVTGGTTLGAKFAGVETKLFQAGLLPYLVYLYFLGKDEARTPAASNFGARFLLLFVFATIPAGIVAKTRYGDILANVDVLHGTSESLLTVSNFLFAFGFATALADAAADEGGDSGDESGDTLLTRRMSAPAALALLVGAAGAGSFALALGAQTAGLGPALHEPSNALSVPTWAVHVSSVTEWAIAMRLIRAHADVSGNKNWRNVSLAMTPFLASGLCACTFHLFYNSPSVSALVPLQALLTLLGNCACGVAAWSVVKEGEAMKADETMKADESKYRVPPRVTSRSSFDWAPEPNAASVLKLAAWSTIGGAGVKYGELLCGTFFLEPTYGKALAVVAAPTATWSAVVFGSSGSVSFLSGLSMDKVKSFGRAGTIAYVIVELGFWAVAFPVAFGWYRVAEGTWLDLSDPADKARLFGVGAVFVNGVRALVPLRLAAALALAPYVESAVGGGRDGGAVGGGDEDGDE